MKRLLLTLTCAGALFAQEGISRVIEIRYINPDAARAVLDIVGGGRVNWKVDNGSRIIAMRGPAELIDAIGAAIKKIDVPAAVPKNIELTFHMLLASPQAEAPAVPQELTGVAQQLRGVFGLKSIRVLETAVLRGREGMGAATNGIMAAPSKGGTQAIYRIKYQNAVVGTAEKGANVRIDKLGFSAQIPVTVGSSNTQMINVGIDTDVDIREGQKVVVGKASVDSGSQSIFLVVTAKVVD